ncbi:MAG: thiazole synthase [Planctomycetes bacterium]|nr:thiazole synthase [Planctomycetota bacterium]
MQHSTGTPGAADAAQAPRGTLGEDWRDEDLVLGRFRLRSRLLVGTGKYASLEESDQALAASGSDCVTVALRRIDLHAPPPPGGSLLERLRRGGYTILPNTAGCYTAADAVRTSVLAREILGTELVKLEVLGDPRTLLPDPVETLVATKELVAQGFCVLVYASDDPILAKRLEQAGATSVMPAGSPIGSGQGILNPNNLRIILESVQVPVIVDAGLGTASDVAFAMELGAAGVLLNTAIAGARQPVLMARSMRLACEAGRAAYVAGRIPKRLHASASSPLDGVSPSSPSGGSRG